MFIIMLHYKKPLNIVEQHVTDHRNYLTECYAKNYFIASGPRNPRTGGVIISQLTDRDTLMKVLAEDPFVLHDIADLEIIEFNPVKYHPDFQPFIH